MDKKAPQQLQLPAHGASVLPSVTVDSYNVEIEDEDGFVGDKARKGAFWDLVDKWRKPLAAEGTDPLGDQDSADFGKGALAELLVDGAPDSAAMVLSAIEEFAQNLTYVIRRFMRLKDWRDTECIVIGGGFSGSRLGELAVARAGLLLKAEDIDVQLTMIRHDPDDAGLLGAAHLLPAWMLKGHDGILAVDVGGTNIRVGAVELNLGKKADLSKARIVQSEIWRHADDDDLTRDAAVERLVEMLNDLTSWCGKNKLDLAPVVGVGCPGIIHEDGSIERGGQNLPGNWQSARFNLPRVIAENVKIGTDAETMVVMHNDAVVQGLSQLPFHKKRRHWAMLTIGTGLGNVRFSTRVEPAKKSKRG